MELDTKAELVYLLLKEAQAVEDKVYPTDNPKSLPLFYSTADVVGLVNRVIHQSLEDLRLAGKVECNMGANGYPYWRAR